MFLVMGYCYLCPTFFICYGLCMIIVNEREESVRFFRGALLALGASTMFWGALAGIIYGVTKLFL